MNIERLDQKINAEIGDLLSEVMGFWNQIPTNERRRLLQKLYLEFGQARQTIQVFVNDGGDSHQLAEKQFADLPEIIQTYIKLAFDPAQETFDRQNICDRLEKYGLPLNF